MKNSKRLYLAALLPFALIVLLFELMPVAATVMRSFTAEGGGGFTLEHYSAIFTKKLYRTALVNSLWVSVLSSVIGLTVAFWGAKAYKSANGGLRNMFLSVLNMTSNFSGIPLAFSYIILLGNVGVLVMLGKHHGIAALADFNIYSIWGLLLCYKKEWSEAVALLGGSETVYWLRVGLPNLLPSILGTFSVLFANAVAAYATAYALMQNNFALLPIKITEQFVGDVVQRREFGSALAVVLMLLMTATIAINDRILKMRTKKAK